MGKTNYKFPISDLTLEAWGIIKTAEIVGRELNAAFRCDAHTKEVKTSDQIEKECIELMKKKYGGEAPEFAENIEKGYQLLLQIREGLKK